MKYITTQLSKNGDKLHLEPFYIPQCTYGEVLTLRVIVGNIRPEGISVIFKGTTESERRSLLERYPTVFEYRITEEDIRGIRTDSVSEFKVKLFVMMDNEIKEIESTPIVRILGARFGQEYMTDVSALYDNMNVILDKLNNV